MAEKNPMPSRVFLNTTAREEEKRGTLYKGEEESAASAWQ